MSLRDEIKYFDGLHVDVLERVLAEHRPTDAFINSLILLVADRKPKIQMGAMWIMKKLIEGGIRPKKNHLLILFDLLPEVTHWLAKLHICQMLSFVKIPSESKGSLVWFLEQNVVGKNTFLRAWCYQGFFELSKQYSEYINYALEQIERGETDKAASVKTRIRHIRMAMSKMSQDK